MQLSGFTGFCCDFYIFGVLVYLFVLGFVWHFVLFRILLVLFVVLLGFGVFFEETMVQA